VCHHLGLHCALLGMTLGIVTDFFNKMPLEPGRCHLVIYPIFNIEAVWFIIRKGVFTMLTLSAIWQSVTLSIKLFPIHTLSPFHHWSWCSGVFTRAHCDEWMYCFSEVIKCVVINTVMIDCNSKSMIHLLCVYICVCVRARA